MNPIIPEKGLTDPHILVDDDVVYLYVGRDSDRRNETWLMDRWEIWSSRNLVDWRFENAIEPRDNYMGPGLDCFAGDIVRRHGKYFWFFSNRTKDIGVMVADRPTGPFRDALGRPLIPADSASSPVYDPDVFIDDDEAHTPYVYFGFGVHHVARLDDSLLALAEPPRPVRFVVTDAFRQSDKPHVFKRDGVYYYIGEGYYATGDNPYGPFVVRGSNNYWHCKTFIWKNQFYIASEEKDLSSYFRTSLIHYLRFRDSGELVARDQDPLGVGSYDAARPRIPAANHTAASAGLKVREHRGPEGGFEVRGLREGSFLIFPLIGRLGRAPLLHLRLRALAAVKIEARTGGLEGALLGELQVAPTPDEEFQTVSFTLTHEGGPLDLALSFRGRGKELLRLCWLSFAPDAPEPRFPARSWDFALSDMGWQALRGTSLEWRALRCHIGGLCTGDFMIESLRYVGGNLDQNKYLRIRLLNLTHARVVRIWFEHRFGYEASRPSVFSEAKRAEMSVRASDNAFRDYIFDLSAHPEWRGDLKQLRLELLGADGGGSWEIDAIEIGDAEWAARFLRRRAPAARRSALA
jgi:hypothetical protein